MNLSSRAAELLGGANYSPLAANFSPLAANFSSFSLGNALVDEFEDVNEDLKVITILFFFISKRFHPFFLINFI